MNQVLVVQVVVHQVLVEQVERNGQVVVASGVPCRVSFPLKEASRWTRAGECYSDDWLQQSLPICLPPSDACQQPSIYRELSLK